MSLTSLQKEITECNQCPRLREWCKKISIEKRKSFANDTYWGKPVDGFGDPKAQLLIVGLAPAAHGANRTGRMFTGDNSGKWLYRALFEHGFSNQEISNHRKDSLKLKNTYITSIVHCAPPDNKPNAEETNRCIPYFERELAHLKQVKVILALGQFAWNGVFRILGEKPKPKFGHNVIHSFEKYAVIGSYHPSQQNTFTKRLTKEMFDQVFETAKEQMR